MKITPFSPRYALRAARQNANVRRVTVHNHTPPDVYIHQIAGTFRSRDYPGISPSDRIIRVLQARDPRVATKGFRSKVLDAIFMPALIEDYGDDEEYVKRLVSRTERRVGKKRARRLLIDKCEVLDMWRDRDARFRPDGFLIDAANWTVVCYEIEDTHPLNTDSIEEYVAAWWCLDHIYWDLHLISYDIYGHHRVHHLGMAGFINDHVREERGKVI